MTSCSLDGSAEMDISLIGMKKLAFLSSSGASVSCCSNCFFQPSTLSLLIRLLLLLSSLRRQSRILEKFFSRSNRDAFLEKSTNALSKPFRLSFPHDLIETLISYDLDILHPECVQKPGGPSFDTNAWKDNGKLHMDDLRGSGGPVRIDSVGGSVLLVRADVHRNGAIFPPFKYGIESPSIRDQHPVWGKGEIETEGFAAMAKDIGFQSWGLPDLEVIHA